MNRDCDRDTLRTAFGRTVRSLRTRAGFTQEAFAFKSGVDRGYMGALERGLHSATLDTICRVVTALGCSYSEFFAEFEQQLQSRHRRRN
jgi:transcriptional regulator with XRE-family HTH domain